VEWWGWQGWRGGGSAEMLKHACMRAHFACLQDKLRSVAWRVCPSVDRSAITAFRLNTRSGQGLARHGRPLKLCFVANGDGVEAKVETTCDVNRRQATELIFFRDLMSGFRDSTSDATGNQLRSGAAVCYAARIAHSDGPWQKEGGVRCRTVHV
jgi:hypothetical protein